MPLFHSPRKPERVQPPRCTNCNTLPYVCESCADYQCRCIVPWLLAPEGGKLRKGGPGRLIRVHYKRDGTPYTEQFIDGFVPSLDDDPDIERLISEEWAL